MAKYAVINKSTLDAKAWCGQENSSVTKRTDIHSTVVGFIGNSNKYICPGDELM